MTKYPIIASQVIVSRILPVTQLFANLAVYNYENPTIPNSGISSRGRTSRGGGMGYGKVDTPYGHNDTISLLMNIYNIYKRIDPDNCVRIDLGHNYTL